MKGQPEAGRESVDSQSGRGRSDWADPGYFRQTSRWRNALRLFVQLLLPPRGHQIVPTRSGLLVLLLAFLLGSAALTSGHNVLFIGLALVLACLVISGLLSWFNLKDCRWRLIGPTALRVGEAAQVQVEFNNNKTWLPAFGFEFVLAFWSNGKSRCLPCPGPVQPLATERFNWAIRPQQRGLEQLKLEAMISRYPFGFLKRTIRDSVAIETVVWPSRCDYGWFPRGASAQPEIESGHRPKGEGVELAQIRRYHAGDPLNRVHWKASARLGHLLVKELDEPVGRRFHLEIDPYAALWPEEAQFERLCSFAGSLAEDLFKRGELLSWRVPGNDQRRVRGLADLRALLDLLGTIDMDADSVPLKQPPLQAGAGRVTFRPQPGGRGVLALVDGKEVGHA